MVKYNCIFINVHVILWQIVLYAYIHAHTHTHTYIHIQQNNDYCNVDIVVPAQNVLKVTIVLTYLQQIGISLNNNASRRKSKAQWSTF